MPELPDITVYLQALETRIVGRRLVRTRLNNPFLLRSVEPGLEATHGRRVSALRRLGKRIAIGLEDDIWLVFHLMIAGRFQWREAIPCRGARRFLLALQFDSGTLVLTEAGTRKRASLHIVRGSEALRGHDPGGLEVLEADADAFIAALTRRNHTLKRALTDPKILSGVGNAYSDEILHRARLSPVQLTGRLTPPEGVRLFEAARTVLGEWTERLCRQTGHGFPERVTAFREGMAVHGRFGKPCPDCGTAVQRIRYAAHETHYCPRCQTGGRLLADRALSRLLKRDWPRSIEALESRRR